MKPEVPADPEDIHPEVKHGSRFNVVWIVPIIAILLGLWLVKRSHDEQGDLITIRFENAADLAIGKTEIKCSNVTIGGVEGITLTDDLDVNVAVRIKPQHLHLIRTRSIFWVVRARLQASSVSGLGTLISGAYIEVDPGPPDKDGKEKRDFIGLEEPPLTPASVPGLRLVLETEKPGSVNVGSGIYFRDTLVGRIESRDFIPSERIVRFGAFIEEPFQEIVTTGTLFWKTSGVKLDVGTEGFNLELPSLDSLISGRISIDQPDEAEPGDPLRDGATAILYSSQEEADVSRFQGGTEFLLLVDQSLRGLKVGAPVEFRGLKIGRVAEISYNLVEEVSIERMPVLIQLDARLLQRHFPPRLIDNEADGFSKAISRKLRASLRTSSLLTGQMFVDIEYYPNLAKVAEIKEGNRVILPVVESGFGRLEDKLAALLDKINSLKLDTLVATVTDTSAEATATLASVREAMDPENGAVAETLVEIQDTVASLNTLLSDPETQAIPADLRTTLASLNASLKPLSSDGAVYGDLRLTLDEIRAGVRSIDRLTTELANKPNSLIFGKDTNTNLIPRSRR